MVRKFTALIMLNMGFINNSLEKGDIFIGTWNKFKQKKEDEKENTEI